jgi:tRNA threonylcarbamoyl adenosine modification protein (Sua5/YciO/YrdC/YwlC family)
LPRDVGVDIVAAGQGTRLGGVPKQFRDIAGEPMLFRTLRPFLDHAEVRTVVVALPAAVLETPPPWLSGLAGPRVRLVAGGAERADSVRAGLAALPRDCTTVLVHDGARPFPSPAVITAVIAGARRGEGAIAALPVTDTLKEAALKSDGIPRVCRTVPRAGLWRAQTPQGFPRALLETAHAAGGAGTDDAELVERAGGTVTLVADSALNLKVTTAEDLLLAACIARAGESANGQAGGPLVPFRTAADLAAAVPAIRAHLEAGKVLAYPTETVYGIGTFASEGALARLSSLKGRPAGKPFLLLISGREMAEAYGLVFTPSARALAEAFWPGPLTLVLAGGEGRLPDTLRGPEGGIAVRHTSHGLMAQLVTALGRPLTSTSANRPGQLPAPGPERILQLFAAEVAGGELLVLDGGALGNVPPSTVVDCSGPEPLLVREGALPRSELRRAVGRLSP